MQTWQKRFSLLSLGAIVRRVKTKMNGLFIRLISLILLLVFAYPLVFFLHPWWVLVQPLGAYDLLSAVVEELTVIMLLPRNLALSIRTGHWWWHL